MRIYADYLLKLHIIYLKIVDNHGMKELTRSMRLTFASVSFSYYVDILLMWIILAIIHVNQ